MKKAIFAAAMSLFLPSWQQWHDQSDDDGEEGPRERGKNNWVWVKTEATTNNVYRRRKQLDIQGIINK